MEAWIHGSILALGLILPLGVQNMFIFSQGATQRTLGQAMPASITASICDTILILLAVLGLSVFVNAIDWLRTVLMVLGFLFLGYMGYVMWRSKNNMNEQHVVPLSTRQQIIFAVSVSLLNPHAILDTVGVIGTSSLRYDHTELILFTTACILVSWIWFFSLAIAGRLLKRLDGSGKLLVVMNKCSAIFIWSMALWLLLDLVR